VSELPRAIHLTTITAYAPTELSDTDTKDDFYNQLAALIQSVPPHDVLAILGDFNAITGVKKQPGAMWLVPTAMGAQMTTQIV